MIIDQNLPCVVTIVIQIFMGNSHTFYVGNMKLHLFANLLGSRSKPWSKIVRFFRDSSFTFSDFSCCFFRHYRSTSVLVYIKQPLFNRILCFFHLPQSKRLESYFVGCGQP